MTKHFLPIPAVLVAVSLTVPHLASAQTFKVDRYSIGGEGGTDYLTAEPGTGRVFVSRGTHVMVIDGRTGKVIGDIPDTPRTHGIALAPKSNHGFTTNGGDSTVTMFDLKTLVPIKKIRVPSGGLDGIMYDDFSDRIILTNHSRPIGTATAIDPGTGEILGVAELEDNAPEGAASDGKGKLFVNNESKNTMQVLDAKTMKVLSSWPLTPCDGPTGIAFDRSSNRIFSGCGKTSVVIDPSSGRVVSTITNGRWSRRAGMGRFRKADLHPGRARRQRHRRPAGFTGQVHRSSHGADHAGREDDRCRSGEARGVSLSTRVWTGAGASTGCAPHLRPEAGLPAVR